MLQAVLAEEGRLFMLLGNEVAAGALFAEAFDKLLAAVERKGEKLS